MLLQQLLSNYQLILASNSPRRHELLKGLDITYQIWPNNKGPETYPQDIDTEEVPTFLAKQKAESLLPKLNEQQIAITCDTIVLCNNKILGKPKNENDAQHMLHTLSARQHTVITGVALTSKNQQKTFDARTQVIFSKLTNQQINYYISHYRPFDKAGAYGIQEWIGFVGIESIQGSYFNVMGLPVQKLYNELGIFVEEENKIRGTRINT